MRLIGVLASGETPSSAEAEDGRTILNQMLDSWSAEKLMIFTNVRTVLTPGSLKQAYTLGTGGDFSVARPPRIDSMSVLITSSTPNIELPIKMLTDEEWQQIPVKDVSSAVPTQVWDDGGFPLRTLSFWPTPNVSLSFVMYAWTALQQFADLTTDYTFPPGYLKALRYNLAVDLAPEFGRPVPAEVAAQAVMSKALLKTMNVQETLLMCDPAVSGRGGYYDWRSDQ